MKKFYSLFMISIIALSCLFFIGCNQNINTPIDLNEFKIEKVNQYDRNVLFVFNYTQEMFDYEIKNKPWTSNQGELIIRCKINQTNNLEICDNVNAMFGIKYEYNGYVLAHKPNEKVYFYKEFEPGDYNVTFYLEYAAKSPYILLRECSISFSVL